MEKRSGGRLALSILCVFLGLVLAVMLAGTVYAHRLMNLMNRVDKGSESTLTEEQMEELCILCDWHDNKNDAKSILVLYQGQFVMNADVIDWLDKNNYDYRGLIEQGLAIDATNLNIY
jgi:hypothetical protein